MLTITHQEIRAMQAAGHPVVCFDVREAIQQRHSSAGGVVMPHNQVAASAALLGRYTYATAVVCAARPPGHCQRTVIAARELRGIGFVDVRELAAGLVQGWTMPLGTKEKMPGYPPSPAENT